VGRSAAGGVGGGGGHPEDRELGYHERRLAMLTPDERAVLVVYCSDQPAAVCPTCSEAVTINRVGADLILARHDFCPTCRVDLTATLRKHLAECTWIRVQGRGIRERAQEIRQQARETAKQSEQARDRADVLAREAEDAQRKSRDVKRGQARAGGGTGMTP
jgi:hypothetical protein